MAKIKIFKNDMNTFLTALYGFSMLSLIGFILATFFQFDINIVLQQLGIVLLGIGLLFISGIFGIKKFLKSGLNGKEISSIVVGTVAGLIIINSGLALFGWNLLSVETSNLVTGLSVSILAGILTLQYAQSLK